jgi:hypothetical protein
VDLDGVQIVSSVCCELIFRIFAVSSTVLLGEFCNWVRPAIVVSSDSDLSDINLLVIEITKHRRKWLRKRVRPIKKMANQVKSKYERTRMRYDNVQKESQTGRNIVFSLGADMLVSFF